MERPSSTRKLDSMRFPQVIFSASYRFVTSPASDQLQQQATYNPFHAAGAFAASANPSQPQPTGYLQPQFTVVPPGAQQPTNPFPVQQAMPTGYIQPQATEANPFRASTVVSQPTGFSPFGQTGALQPAPTGVNPFSAQNGFLGANTFSNNPFPVSAPASNPFPTSPNANPFGALNSNPYASASSSTSPPSSHLNPFPSQSRSVSQPFSFASPNQPTSTDFSNTAAPTPASAFNANPTTAFSVPARPASTPLTQTKTSSPSLKPVKAHQTGSRNPFGVPKAPSPPPVPRAPTLFELANGVPQYQPPSQSPTQVQPQQTGAPATTFTSVASSFLSGSSGSPPVPQLTTSFTALGSGTSASTPTSTTTGSTFSDSVFGSVACSRLATPHSPASQLARRYAHKPRATARGSKHSNRRHHSARRYSRVCRRSHSPHPQALQRITRLLVLPGASVATLASAHNRRDSQLIPGRVQRSA
jgi:hypothetical protein